MGQHKQNAGIAMLTAMVFLAIMIAIVGIGTVVGLSNYRLAKDNKTTIQAEHAADSAIERTIFEFWHLPNHLAKQNGLGDQLAMNNYKGVLDGTLDLGVNFPILQAGANSTFGTPFQLTGSLDNGANYEAAIRRKDVGTNVVLNVVAKGIIGNSERYVTQTLTFGSANPWDFAILTDNIECTFCHLEVYSIEAGYKPNGELRNFFKDSLADIDGFERVRVGSIASLKLGGNKHSEADSYILGTIYTAEDSNFVSGNSTIFTSGLQEDTAVIDAGNNFNSTFKKIAQWDNGQDAVQDCNRDDCSAFGQMYTNYPPISQGQPDGLLQDNFPLPVTDDNNDRLIDNTEWDHAVISGGNVSVRRKGNVNNILNSTDTSGIILIPHNQYLGDINRSEKEFLSSSAKSSFGGHHAILRGTPGNPLNFNGKVYVDGDVVISGRVSGDGMIIARGNVYIVGDITYDCGRQQCDYSQPHTLPRFALSAVGNITSGIYGLTGKHRDSSVYSRSVKTTLDGRDSFASPTSFRKADGSIHDRFKAQDIGTLTDSANQASLASTQMAIFNKHEYDRARANSQYIPRFYIFRQGQHDWLQRCHHTGCWQHVSPYTNLHGPSITARNLDGTEFLAGGNPVTVNNGNYDSAKDPEILNRAVFVSMSPKDHWLLGGYGIKDADFSDQFPSPSCTEANIEDYIETKLFSTNIENGQQKLGAIQTSIMGTPEEDCYHEAIARERLRAMNSEVVLQEMWRTYVEDAGARDRIINETAVGDSFRLDAIVYTGNAFFFISPNLSTTKGEAVVNGSFIAADMGVLVGGSRTKRHNSLMHSNSSEQDARGLRIQYDRRLIELISDVGEGVSIGKSSFEILTANEAKQILGGP